MRYTLNAIISTDNMPSEVTRSPEGDIILTKLEASRGPKEVAILEDDRWVNKIQLDFELKEDHFYCFGSNERDDRAFYRLKEGKLVPIDKDLFKKRGY